MAWSLATGAAVTLSWWGVHTVMSGTVYDRPAALPLTSVADSPVTAPGPSAPDPEPRASSTHRPEPEASRPPSPSPPPSGPTPGTRTPSKAPTTAPPSASAAASASAQPGTVKSYAVDGGRVAFDIAETSAELVSATPASGWQMQVWKQDTWIRVTFTKDDREISVFCVWHDTAPRVEIDERTV